MLSMGIFSSVKAYTSNIMINTYIVKLDNAASKTLHKSYSETQGGLKRACPKNTAN